MCIYIYTHNYTHLICIDDIFDSWERKLAMVISRWQSQTFTPVYSGVICDMKSQPGKIAFQEPACDNIFLAGSIIIIVIIIPLLFWMMGVAGDFDQNLFSWIQFWWVSIPLIAL